MAPYILIYESNCFDLPMPYLYPHFTEAACINATRMLYRMKTINRILVVYNCQANSFLELCCLGLCSLPLDFQIVLLTAFHYRE